MSQCIDNCENINSVEYLKCYKKQNNSQTVGSCYVSPTDPVQEYNQNWNNTTIVISTKTRSDYAV